MAIGIALALILWPLLPIFVGIAIAIIGFNKLNQKAQGSHPSPPAPPPEAKPMLTNVFAEAKWQIHNHNIEHMERCFRHPCQR